MPDHERLNEEARRRLLRQTPVFLRADIGKLMLPLAGLSWALAGLVLLCPPSTLHGVAGCLFANAWAGFVTKLALAQRRTRWVLTGLAVVYALLAIFASLRGGSLASAGWAAGPLGGLAGIGVGRIVYKSLLRRSVRQP